MLRILAIINAVVRQKIYRCARGFQVDELQAQLMTLKREHSVTLDRRAQLESRNLGLEGQSVKLEELLADAAAEVASTNEKVFHSLQILQCCLPEVFFSSEWRLRIVANDYIFSIYVNARCVEKDIQDAHTRVLPYAACIVCYHHLYLRFTVRLGVID